MIKNIAACLILNLITFNTLYGQTYECDNNYGDCGTPNQSGGGGGGGGSVLIANTDLGDTYQNADDFDDDGIEDLHFYFVSFHNHKNKVLDLYLEAWLV